MRRKPNGDKVPDADWKIGTLVRTDVDTGGLFAYVKRYDFISVTPGSLELIATVT